ncbi:hypothetical protein R6Q59_022745 [Mikania micrantha]
MTLPPPTTAPNHQRQRITTTPPPETTLPKPFPTTANSCPHSPPPRFDRLPQHCCHQRQRLTTTAGNHSACDILFTTVAVTITTQTLPYHNKLLPQPHPTEDRVYHNLPPATTHRLDETIAAVRSCSPHRLASESITVLLIFGGCRWAWNHRLR